MSLLKIGTSDGHFRIRIKQDEIRIEARADRAFPIVDPAETSRTLAHPPHDVGQRKAATATSRATVETSNGGIMAGVTWEATIRLQNGDQVRVQVVAPSQPDAKQMIELQYGNGSVIFGPARVNLMRAV